MELSKALKTLREYHGLKQFETAERLGLTKSVVSELESGGRPVSMDVIMKYADAFKIPASSVLLLAELSGSTAANQDDQTISKIRRNIASKTFKILDWINEKTKIMAQ